MRPANFLLRSPVWITETRGKSRQKNARQKNEGGRLTFFCLAFFCLMANIKYLMSKVSVIFDRFFEKKQYQFWLLFIISTVLLFSSLRKSRQKYVRQKNEGGRLTFFCLAFFCLMANIKYLMSKVSVIFDRFFEKKQYQFWLLFIFSLYFRAAKSFGHSLFLEVLLFSSLRKGGLSGYDDAFYASYGKQMLLSGDWWSLRLNGYHIFEFPPLFPWMEALSMKVFGITDFAAKVPAALSGLFTIVLTYLVAKELFLGQWTPILAMAILSGTQIFIKYAMHAMTDAPFTFFFTLALYLYLKGLKKPRIFMLSGAAIGAAVLTRSVLGLIPFGVIFLHLIVTGRYKLIWSKPFLGAVVISIALPGAWYGSQYSLYGRQFINEHFSFVASKILGQGAVARDDLREKEVILCRNIVGQDVTVKSPGDDARSRSDQGGRVSRIIIGFAEYPTLLLRHYWPWLPLMLFGFAVQVGAVVRSRDSGAALLVIWVVCTLITFSLSEAKALRYIMPVFPAFAILAAEPLSRMAASVRSARYVKFGYLVVLIALLLAALFPKPRMRAEDMQSLAPIVDANAIPQQRVILYTSGELHHNYKSQFVWYSDHYCAHLTELNSVKDALISCPGAVAVLDKQSYAELRAAMGESIKSLGESDSFVCIKSRGLRE